MRFVPFLALHCALVILALLACQPALAAGDTNNDGLMLTDGATALEGSSGGGLASWAVIAGRKTRDGFGVAVSATHVTVSDFDLQAEGVAVGYKNRLEVSVARQSLDTHAVGARLGIGRGYSLDQTIIGAKLRLIGDLVYDLPYLPQVSVGVQYKQNDDPAVLAAVGAHEASGTEFYLAATKLILSKSLLINGTARLTAANQTGLLGFGSGTDKHKHIEIEASLGYQLSRRVLVGGEYRTKPSQLSFSREDDWKDIFVAYAVTSQLTLTGAFVDLGTIATASRQCGALLSIKSRF